VSPWLEAPTLVSSRSSSRHGDEAIAHCRSTWASRWWWRVQGCIAPTLWRIGGGRLHGDAHQHPVTVPGWLKSWWSRDIDVFVPSSRSETEALLSSAGAPRSALVLATLPRGASPSQEGQRGPSPQRGSAASPCRVFWLRPEMPSPTLGEWQGVGGQGAGRADGDR